jgi:hypothetical protein
LLGSINDAIGIGGVTENIFKVVAKDLGNNSNHFQKNNKQGESLTGLHPKAILPEHPPTLSIQHAYKLTAPVNNQIISLKRNKAQNLAPPAILSATNLPPLARVLYLCRCISLLPALLTLFYVFSGTKGSGGLPYERYHQGKLIYNRTPALTDQPAAYDNHACPDSPGTINAVRKEFRAAHESEKLSAPPLPSRPQNVQVYLIKSWLSSGLPDTFTLRIPFFR